MQYLILIVTVLTVSSQSILMKQYNQKSSSANPYLFSAITVLFAMLFFILSAGSGLHFAGELVPYAVGFAIAYGAAQVGLNLAIATGSLAISSLVSSYSLLIPTFYGLLFLKESLKATAYIGIVLLFLSLYFINMKKEAMSFSVKWLVYLILAFVGNGMCSTVQKMQQLKFDGGYKNEFMIISYACVFLIMLIILVIKRTDIKGLLKKCLIFAAPTGLANGATNLFVMILTGLLPTALLFPTVSAGGSLIMFFVSRFLYKEKIAGKQLLGYGLGVVSVVLMNL